MKKEYDFSKAERGKFSNPKGNFLLPIYLEPKVDKFFRNLAQKKKIEVSVIINDLLRKEIELLNNYSLSK